MILHVRVLHALYPSNVLSYYNSFKTLLFKETRNYSTEYTYLPFQSYFFQSCCPAVFCLVSLLSLLLDQCPDLLSSWYDFDIACIEEIWHLCEAGESNAIAIEMPEQHRSVEECMYRRCTRT